MINMHCETGNERIHPISDRTSFDILLIQEQVPAKGNIGSLPVVNSNPTQLSIVNAGFLKYLAIADGLETGCIV